MADVVNSRSFIKTRPSTNVNLWAEILQKRGVQRQIYLKVMLNRANVFDLDLLDHLTLPHHHQVQKAQLFIHRLLLDCRLQLDRRLQSDDRRVHKVRKSKKLFKLNRWRILFYFLKILLLWKLRMFWIKLLAFLNSGSEFSITNMQKC